MKALIAAGGRGTRLRPITHTLNKHLIPIANKPMIFYALEKIAACGVTEVGININEGDKELPAIIKDGSQWGLNITYIEQLGGPLGLAHIIKNAKPFLNGESFIFYLGDNIISGSINHLVDHFNQTAAGCVLAFAKVKDPQRFGVPIFDENQNLKGFEEKPQNPKTDFAVTGLYICDPTILEGVEYIKPSWRNEYEITDASQYVLDKGRPVHYKEITGWWKDTGKPSDLLEANALVLTDLKPRNDGTIEKETFIQGDVVIGSGSRILGQSIIRGPVIIGDNTVIDSSYIGPYTSIGSNVKIKNTELENSIVFDGAQIDCGTQNAGISAGVRIVDSILGKNCQVGSVNSRFPLGKKLIIGDNASVEL